MIELKELQQKLSNILNGLDSSTSIYDNSCDDFYFAVKTYGTRLETIANQELKRNVIPVYINGVSGNIEPIENLNEVDSSFDVYIYFPIKYKEQFFKLSNFLLSALNAKTYNYGTISGNALTTLSVPELDEIQDLQLNELSSFLEQDYNLSISKTEQWGILSFSLYFYQVANLGEEDGYILGNQVKYYITYKGLTEEITATQRIINYEADTYSEQVFSDSETASIAKNGITTWTINPYIRNNTFWKTFLYDFENGDLYNETIILKTVYPFATYQRELLISNCVSVDELGELKSVTLTLTKKIGASNTITTYYTLNLKYYINNVEDTSLSNSVQIESGNRVYPSTYAKSITSYVVDSYTPNTSFVMNKDNTITYYYVDAVLNEPTITGGTIYYNGTITNVLKIPTIENGIVHYQGEISNYLTSLTLTLSSNNVVVDNSITYDYSYEPSNAIKDLTLTSSNSSDFVIDGVNKTITGSVGGSSTNLTLTDSYTGLTSTQTLTCSKKTYEAPEITITTWKQSGVYYTLALYVYTRNTSGVSYNLYNTEYYAILEGKSVNVSDYSPDVPVGYEFDSESGDSGTMTEDKTFKYYYTYNTYTLTLKYYVANSNASTGSYTLSKTETKTLPYNTDLSDYKTATYDDYVYYKTEGYTNYLTSSLTIKYYFIQKEVLESPDSQSGSLIDNGDGTYTIDQLTIRNNNSVDAVAHYSINVVDSNGGEYAVTTGTINIDANSSYSDDLTFSCNDLISATMNIYFTADNYTTSENSTITLK